MQKLLIVISICLTLFSLPSFAETDSGTAFVEKCLNAYVKEGANAFIKTYLAGSAMAENPIALNQAKGLEKIEGFYGKPESYDIVKASSISPHSKMVVFTINYLTGVVFGKMQIYQSKSGQWIALKFDYNTDATAVFPNNLIYDK